MGGKVVDFAKGAGRGALKVAKAVGLDRAYNAARSAGGKAIGLAKSAAAGLKKRFGPVAAALGKAAAATVVLPVGIVCATLKCPPVSKFCDLLKRFGRFLSGAKKVMTNPGVVIGAIKQSLGSKIEQVPERAKAATTRAVTFSEPASSHLSGIWQHLEPKLEYLKDHWWDVIKETAWGLLWPWPGVFGDLKEIWSEINKAWSNIRSLRWSDLLDNYLTIQQLAIGTLGRLYGWFLVASVLIGAIIGAFFGGAGAIPGAGAGLAFAGEVGKGLLIADVAAQSAIIGKAGFDLAFRSQSVGERENDYEQIASSGLTLAITGALMLLGAIASRIAKALIARVRNLFRGRPPEKVPIKPPVREPASPNKPPHEARIRESEPIRTSDGHEVKVTEDGQLVRCSDCVKIRMEHRRTLGERSDLNNELRRIETDATSFDPSVRRRALEEAVALRDRLNNIENARGLDRDGLAAAIKEHSKRTARGDDLRYVRYQRRGGQLGFEDWRQRMTGPAPPGTGTGPFDKIAEIRRQQGLPDVDVKSRTGTVGMYEHPGGDTTYGANHNIAPDTSLRQDLEGHLRKRFGNNLPNTTFLEHAEAHTLARAHARYGALGEEVVLYVDRMTCGYCRAGLPRLAELYGIKKGTIRWPGGEWSWP